MRRNKFEPPGSDGAGSEDLASKCGIETEAYIRSAEGWQLPEADRIVHDLRRCGGSVQIFLTILLPDATTDEKTILLGALLLVVREVYEAHEAFKKAREAAEEASLIQIQDRLYKTADAGDVQAMKFLLERRYKNMFGRDAKAIDDNEEFIKQEIRRLAEG